ncbi:MAG TPA: enoyl-CoA hydratase-related protein [Mycobacteriales bacterium]|nr:enoyl-CoA hydratase-related protein [Mycobacteriales bacterium]
MDDEQWQGFTITGHPSGVRVVTLNDSERLNVMTQGLKRDMVEMLIQAQNDDGVRALLFTGAGRAFCAGDDVSGEYHAPAHAPTRSNLLPPTGEQAIRRYASLRTVSQALTRALRDFDKPTVAAVNGAAIQSGLSLALGCDYRVASTTARLGSATLRFGYLPDEGGHYLLAEYLGAPRALEFLLQKKIVPAQEALRLGLVSEVVEPMDLMERAIAVTTELAEGPQVSMRLLKRALWRAAHGTLDDSLDDIALRASLSDPHPDAAEGVAAFRERRPPQFNRWLDEES